VIDFLVRPASKILRANAHGYAEGRSLRLEDAVALALAAADPPA